MKTIKMILLLSALTSFSIAGFAEATEKTGASGTGAQVPDITGTYQCKGYDPSSKSNYTNPITVTKNGDTYAFQWLNSKRYPFNLGTGIIHSGLKNVVSVVFWDPKKSDFFGTMVYEVKSDGSLTGEWVVQATNDI